MAHPFLVKDIARQAGVSTATVDRVLHGREHVRAHMVRRVEQAIAALDRQRGQVGAKGRTFMIDLVMDTPARFATEVRDALDAEMAALRPVLLRARHETRELWSPDDIVATLDAIARRGSHGVLLKAPDVPVVVDAVARLVTQGIPVVTVATDLPTSRRLAYAGLDHAVAGETAAWLVGQWLATVRRAAVLVSISSVRFQGEATRGDAFRQALQRDHPRLRIVDVSEGQGLHERTATRVRSRLRAEPDVVAVYSAGGANAAILDAFAQEGRRLRCFIGHDLDADNVRLLRERRIHAVLHHDLRHDMRRACRLLLAAQGVSGLDPAPGLSPVHVVTPANLPA